MSTRRSFLKTLAGTAALCLSPVRELAAFTLGESDPASFSVVRGANPEAAARKAVELIGGMKSFVSTGDVVFIKPNISWDKKPEQAATTNPRVVEAVVRMVKEAGAKEIIVADNTCNDARRTYKRSGIREAAERAGAEVPFVEKRKFVQRNLGGEVITTWEVYQKAIEADKIINLPIAKHHGLSSVTLSMKNLMGLIGGRRDLLHQKLPQSIVDLTAYFKPALTILDAVRILKANGPQGSTLNDVEKLDLIAASPDPVRIDAFGITLFGESVKSNNPLDYPHIEMARKRGLGRADYRNGGYIEVNLG
ncbi:MAG: DUF362 domain-containing protein [Candidatus Krumholzibacteriota bacterium]|nr:DUF362 domain-containing protein [Candidatus Krumholzibacteriota bacterium]